MWGKNTCTISIILFWISMWLKWILAAIYCLLIYVGIGISFALWESPREMINMINSGIKCLSVWELELSKRSQSHSIECGEDKNFQLSTLLVSSWWLWEVTKMQASWATWELERCRLKTESQAGREGSEWSHFPAHRTWRVWVLCSLTGPGAVVLGTSFPELAMILIDAAENCLTEGSNLWYLNCGQWWGDTASAETVAEVGSFLKDISGCSPAWVWVLGISPFPKSSLLPDKSCFMIGPTLEQQIC